LWLTNAFINRLPAKIQDISRFFKIQRKFFIEEMLEDDDCSRNFDEKTSRTFFIAEMLRR